MTLKKSTTRTFHRKLYAGILQKITLLKRGNNQKQGTVKSYTLFQCRHSAIHKVGSTIQGDMNTGNRVVWHIPAVELDRVGINYLNPLDRIIDKYGRYWQPEKDSMLTEKLFENHLCCDCVRIDPPSPPAPLPKTGL